MSPAVAPPATLTQQQAPSPAALLPGQAFTTVVACSTMLEFSRTQLLEGEGGIARLYRACAMSGCCGNQVGAAKSAQCGALTAKRVEMQRELRRLGVRLFGSDKPCRVLDDDDDTAQRKKARAAGRPLPPVTTTTSTKAPLHWWEGK